MKSNKNKSSLWQISAAAFVLGSMVGTFFISGKPSRKKRNEIYEEQQKIIDQNLTVPSNATFGVVWPVIYLGTAALAIHQALPSQRNNLRYKKARPWLITCYALNGIFGYFFSSGKKTSRVGAFFTTILSLPPAIALHKALEIGKNNVPEPENTFRKSISLYTGWLTVATVVSAGNLLIEAGFKPDKTGSARWAYAILPITAALGYATYRQLHDPYYLAPFAAGFAGIATKQIGNVDGVAALAGLGALSAGGLVATEAFAPTTN